MKRYLIVVACLGILLCACEKAQNNLSPNAVNLQEETTEGTTVHSTTEENAGERDSGLSIVSDYHPEYRDLVADGGKMEPEDFEKIYQYAEYCENGIQMLAISPSFLSGRLVYEVSNVRIAHSALEMGLPTNCFSPDFCEINESGERLPPKWILEDGSFKSQQVILVDVKVTNDGAEVRKEADKFGNETDPYTFSAGSFLFLYSDNTQPGRSNYDVIRYFSGMSDDPNHVYSFRLTPGESTTFTLGFVIGKGGTFDSTEGVFLSNVSGETGILIDMQLGESQ